MYNLACVRCSKPQALVLMRYVKTFEFVFCKVHCLVSWM